MKKYIINKSSLLFIFLSVMMISCMDETATIWDGNLVEWEGAVAGSNGVYIRVNDGDPVTDRLRVNLVAPQSGQPVNVTFEVDEENTTAIEGVHYNLLDENSITIPANESYGYVNFEVFDDNMEPGETYVLVLRITGSDVPVSENYDVVTHSMQVSCPSDIPEGIFTAVAGGESTDGCPPVNPIDGFEYDVEIKALGDGEYSLSDFWAGVYQEWYGACYGYAFETSATFVDICNNLSISVTDAFNCSNVGTGTYDPNTGVISIEWSNCFGDTGYYTIDTTP